jgi:Fur family peroxide stress response transcriptional regulator
MERSIRYSKKREAILEAIRDTDLHPSADWVYQKLKPTHPDLSLGTVYRNLAFFKEQGTVCCVGVVNGQERFDAVTEPHTHFICGHCGAVIDLHKIPVDPALDRKVGEQYGFRVAHHKLVFHGICDKCLSPHHEVS